MRSSGSLLLDRCGDRLGTCNARSGDLCELERDDDLESEREGELERDLLNEYECEGELDLDLERDIDLETDRERNSTLLPRKGIGRCGL